MAAAISVAKTNTREVDADAGGARNSDRRPGEQSLHARHRDHETEQRADRGEHETLGEKEPKQPRPARADRRTKRDLATTRHRSRQQQVRDVDARDEQQQPGRAEQREQRGTKETGDLSVERDGAHVPVRRSTLCSPPPSRARESVQLALRPLDADARLEPRDALHEVREARVLREIPLELLPEIGFARDS